MPPERTVCCSPVCFKSTIYIWFTVKFYIVFLHKMIYISLFNNYNNSIMKIHLALPSVEPVLDIQFVQSLMTGQYQMVIAFQNPDMGTTLYNFDTVNCSAHSICLIPERYHIVTLCLPKSAVFILTYIHLVSISRTISPPWHAAPLPSTSCF